MNRKKESKDGDDDNYQKINSSMELMYGNGKSAVRYFGDSFQLNHLVLDSGAMCHMIPQVSTFIPRLLEDMGLGLNYDCKLRHGKAKRKISNKNV